MGSIHDYLDRCTTLAVLGGTFDPIHNGHLAIAEAVLHKFKPQRVLFVPCGHPPHKPNRFITEAEHRYQMALLATCEHPGFDVSRIELKRESASYTIETIKSLREICLPNVTIYFIIGADSLEEIHLWKNAQELLMLCEFVAVSRLGHEKARYHAQHLNETYGAKIHVMEEPLLEISGTNIRERFVTDQPVRGLMPRLAENYAREKGLYKHYNAQAHYEWVKAQIKERLTPKRFLHTLGVIEEAEKLAKFYKADIIKARWAALLHDCTKEYSKDKKYALCTLWGIPLDEVLDENIDLTHGTIAAESAKRDYYISDPEILQAVIYHTLGHKDMTMLDKIIMLADYIEPNRENYEPLTEMRKLAYTNINKALYIGIKSTIAEEKALGNLVHPLSKIALKELKKLKK